MPLLRQASALWFTQVLSPGTPVRNATSTCLCLILYNGGQCGQAGQDHAADALPQVEVSPIPKESGLYVDAQNPTNNDTLQRDHTEVRLVQRLNFPYHARTNWERESVRNY